MAVIDKTTVELDQLYLDEANPRFDPVDSQEAAIELLCDNEDVYSLPIRLRHTPTRCRVRPFPGIEFGVGRRFHISSEAEQ